MCGALSVCVAGQQQRLGQRWVLSTLAVFVSAYSSSQTTSGLSLTAAAEPQVGRRRRLPNHPLIPTWPPPPSPTSVVSTSRFLHPPPLFCLHPPPLLCLRPLVVMSRSLVSTSSCVYFQLCLRPASIPDLSCVFGQICLRLSHSSRPPPPPHPPLCHTLCLRPFCLTDCVSLVVPSETVSMSPLRR